MDMINNRPIWICTALNGWYPAGLDRLQRSLIHHGTSADMMLFRDALPPNSPTHEQFPYLFKVHGMLEAIRRGYKVMVHLDASFWAIKRPDHIFDIIYDNGVFGFRTGYNCAQTCTDALLQRLGYTRDKAEAVPEIATGFMGINIDNPKGKEAFNLWAQICLEGYTKTSRFHNPDESLDPRYLHSRQEQSVWSLVLHKLGISVDDTDHVSYYGTGYNPEKCCFFIGGI